MPERQQILQLWLSTAALDTNVVAWAFYDGADGEGPSVPTESPPYSSGVAALKDGWFLLQAPQPVAPRRDHGQHQSTGLTYGFVFERRV